MLVNLGFSKNFEERSLAHLWQADNAGFHSRSIVDFARAAPERSSLPDDTGSTRALCRARNLSVRR
jgi:hypothetical protein